MYEVIFSEGNFTLVKENGVGVNDTPWEGLSVRSSDAAAKHVVEVRLHNVNWNDFNGTPVKYKYDTEMTEISHGMRMSRDSFTDTEEYIEVLKSALTFAKRVNQWIIDNGWDS